MEKNNQSIKCDVKGCTYYSNEDLCTLKEIKVCNNNADHAEKKEETLCSSYKCKKC